MDDNLEKPSPAPPKERGQVDDYERQSDSEDEDAAPDWTKLAPRNVTVIPKRGEKEFEPKPGGGSGLQIHVLERARNAMFDALRGTRTTSNKHISYGIWYPAISRVHVTIARGTHLASMGHTVSRPSDTKEKKRLELLPEEAIYLIERGALFCWKDIPSFGSIKLQSNSEEVSGSPMTVQQAYSEMVGKEDLSLNHFQVYAYLRRLGYVVTRTEPPTPAYPKAAPFPPPNTRTVCSVRLLIRTFFSTIFKMFTSPFDWWRPLRLHHNYPSIYQALRFLPSGHNVPLHPPTQEPQSPYKIFFNVYKPVTTFRKTAPPPPDYSIVVVDARTTPMPTLHELVALFGELPELPPPVPRQRQPLNPKPNPIESSNPIEQTVLQRLISWIRPVSPSPSRRPNPFPSLRQGRKMVVIAAVDAGNINFFRFSQGVFEEWPMNFVPQ